MQVLLDKDNRIGRELVPSDIQYHVQKPNCRQFDDCCNEFWNVTTYVVKGLCRRELLFAIDHLNQILRPELLRMLAWKVGFDPDYDSKITRYTEDMFARYGVPEQEEEYGADPI